MRKYRTDVPIVWPDVLKAIEIQIMRERKLFESHQEDIVHELSHKSVDRNRLDFHTSSAFSICEKVFYWYGALCSLRQFLGMKPRTPEQLKIKGCFDFYGQCANESETALLRTIA